MGPNGKFITLFPFGMAADEIAVELRKILK